MNEQKRCIICGKVTGSADNFCSLDCRQQSIENDREMLKREWAYWALPPVKFAGLV